MFWTIVTILGICAASFAQGPITTRKRGDRRDVHLAARLNSETTLDGRDVSLTLPTAAPKMAHLKVAVGSAGSAAEI